MVPANEIALRNIGRPLGNTTLIGAFAAATGELKLENLIAVVKNRFSGKAQEGNIQAVKEGFEFVKNKLKGYNKPLHNRIFGSATSSKNPDSFTAKCS